MKRLKFVTLILFAIVSDGHDVLFWRKFDRYESQIVWTFAAETLDNFVKTALSMAYRLLLTNMDTNVDGDLDWWRLMLEYGWQDAETLWFERIGVHESISLVEMEKSLFKDEKTNADILIGASNFKKLFRKMKPMG